MRDATIDQKGKMWFGTAATGNSFKRAGVWRVHSASDTCDEPRKTIYPCTTVSDCPTGTANDRISCGTPTSCTAGVCVYTPKALGTACRSSVGICDVADMCDGTHIYCP